MEAAARTTPPVPLVYFLGTRPSWWRALYPCFVSNIDLDRRSVFVVVGDRHAQIKGVSTLPEEIERRWTFREARVRLHQGRFRAAVLTAYRDQCAICRLKEPRLLDGAHILPDASPGGIASVANGLSLCSIHHRAFDQDLIGVSPDFQVSVAKHLLEENDGPMLELLKKAHRQSLALPRDAKNWPDRDRLEERFTRFRAA